MMLGGSSILIPTTLTGPIYPAETIRDPGMVGTLRNSHIPGKEVCTMYLARMLGVLGRPRVTGGLWLAHDYK